MNDIFKKIVSICTRTAAVLIVSTILLYLASH